MEANSSSSSNCCALVSTMRVQHHYTVFLTSINMHSANPHQKL
jgi:hypothetical protein